MCDKCEIKKLREKVEKLEAQVREAGLTPVTQPRRERDEGLYVPDSFRRRGYHGYAGW